jgi:hypothetical protein
MIRLFTTVAGLMAVMVALLVAARFAGRINRSPSMAIMELYRCSPEPCWHNIRPGVTTLDEAKTILAADSGLMFDHGFYRDNCWQVLSMPSWRACFGPLTGRLGNLTGYLYLNFASPPQAPRLGDVLALFGEPTASKLCWYKFGVAGSNARSVMGADIYWEDGLYVGAYNPLEPDSYRLSPHMPLFLMSYAQRNAANEPPWRGFVQQSAGRGC